MRTLILASVAALLAAPAFADDTATATYTLNVAESCTFDTDSFTQGIALTGNTLDVVVTCNSEFDLSFAGGGAGGVIAVSNTDGTEVDGTDYTNAFIGTISETSAALPGTTDGDGDNVANDATVSYSISWTGTGASTNTDGLASGDYSGTATVTLTAEDA